MIKNKKNKNVLLSTAEKNLIINSSICTKDSELKSILKDIKKSIFNKNLEGIKIKNERVYQNLNSKESREELIEKSSIEWKNEKPIGMKKQPCQLCENTKSELKYIILNTITGKRLEVGSSCIMKFPRMKEKYHGESITTTDKWLKDFPERIDRLGKFADIYSGGKDIFQIWKIKYDNFEIEFPKDYDEEFRKIKNEANRIYTGYIKGNLDEKELEKFQICINEFSYFYKKCEKFYRENKNNRYICTKNIAKFLKNRDLNTTLYNIKERDCFIPRGLAKNISDISFIKNFKEEISTAFNQFNIKLQKMDSQFIEFIYKYKTFEPIKLVINPYKFTQLYSELFYGENILKDESIFDSMILKNEKNNINEFLGIIEYWLNKDSNIKIYRFDYDVILHEKQNAELHKKKEKVYINISVQDISSNYVKLLYIKNNEINEFLSKEIQNAKWITYKERDKNDIGNISSIFALGKEDEYEQYEK